MRGADYSGGTRRGGNTISTVVGGMGDEACLLMVAQPVLLESSRAFPARACLSCHAVCRRPDGVLSTEALLLHSKLLLFAPSTDLSRSGAKPPSVAAIGGGAISTVTVKVRLSFLFFSRVVPSLQGSIG